MKHPPLARPSALLVTLSVFALAAPGFSQAPQQEATASPDALHSAVKTDEVRAFYEAAGWQIAWSPRVIEALRSAMSKRAQHGLDHMEFEEPSPQSPAVERDAGWTRLALAYAAALARGAVDPAELHEVYTLSRPQADLAKPLASAVASGRIEAWLDSLAPDDAEYRKLSEAYQHYADQPRRKDRISQGKAIHLGDADPRVTEIADALAGNGYLAESDRPSDDGSGKATYTRAIANAVKALQRDYGIRADGVVGPNTLAVLNIGPDDQVRALAVALERRRWLSRNAPATRIDVNTAAATLRYYRDGKLVDERKVIVGKPDWATPALAAPIYRLVANPTWTVPKSIERETLSGKSGAWLRRNNMKRRADGYIVQQPGPDNALGLVKFDMRDDQAIYLHDTSNRALFDRSQRHLSHGCVRVADAPGFASMLAEAEGVTDKWTEARGSGEQTFVDLPSEVPVRLLYWNAFVDADDKVAVRTDPYGWNDAVAEKLGFGNRKSAKARVEQSDIAP